VRKTWHGAWVKDNQHNYFEVKEFPLAANVTATDMLVLAKCTLF
jgi:hypothetical protein